MSLNEFIYLLILQALYGIFAGGYKNNKKMQHGKKQKKETSYSTCEQIWYRGN